MERMAYFTALATGLAGLICGLLLAKRRGAAAGVARSQWLFVAGLPLLVFAATLPSRPPFESGHGFGSGFLLGGLGAALAAWLVLRAEARDESRSGGMASTLALISPQSVGLIVSVSPLLWLRQNLLDTLLGVAIGWLCSSLPLLGAPGVGIRVSETPSQAEESDADSLPLLAGIGFVATLCALFALGEMRGSAAIFHSTQRVSWNVVGAILAAGVPFALLLCALPDTLFLRIGSRLPVDRSLASLSGAAVKPENAGNSAASVLRGSFGLTLFLCLTIFLSQRIMPQGMIWRLALAGVATAGLSLIAAGKAARSHENSPAVSQHHALGLLIFAAGGMLSYQWLQGYGVGIWLLSVWLIVGYVLVRALESERPAFALHDTAQRFLNLALFGVVLLLYRVTQSRFSEDIASANLTDQYALFGLLVGAFTPAFLSGLLSGRGENRLFRLLPVGLLTLAIPGVALLLYGAKCALALLIGAALSFGLFLASSSHNQDDANAVQNPKFKIQNSLFALALALALAQWSGRALDYTLLAKAQKVHLLEAIGAAAVVLILLSDYGGKFRSWRENRDGGAGGKGAA